MSRHETSLAHAARIERVVAHIADHLDAALDLERLAEIACFSPWHFHRVYVAVTGESVADTLRRLRLHRAAAELSRSGRPIGRIAKRAGYGSLAAFSRAFAAAYGRPPAAWRRHGQELRPDFPQHGVPLMPQTAATYRLPVNYDVTIEAFEGATLIALPHRGDYLEVGRTFERLMVWAGPRGLMGPQTRLIGLYYDDPASKPKAELRSEACITAPADVEPGLGMHRQAIAAGPVARLVHKGPYADLDVAYAYLYHTWLPASGRAPGEAPCFEEYLNDPRGLPPQEWLTAVRLPLQG